MNQKNRHLDGLFRSPLLFFVIVYIGLSVFFLIRILISHGAVFGKYFVTDFADTSMDFFNPLAEFGSSDPYATNSNYPAFCMLLFRLLRSFLPPDAPEAAVALRTYLPAQMIFIFLMTACLAVDLLCMLSLLKDGNSYSNKIVSLMILLCGPMLFLIERGNILILAYTFALLFFCLKESSSKAVRYFSYFCLAVSAGIKIYPALFSLLIVRRSKREFFFCGALILVILIAPFFAFNGIASILKMLHGVSMSSEVQLAKGIGKLFSFEYLIRDLGAILGIKIINISVVYRVIVLLIAVLVSMIAQREWCKVFSLVLACVWFPSFSATYTLLWFSIPFLILISNGSSQPSMAGLSKADALIPTSFAIILSALALPDVQITKDVWPNALNVPNYNVLNYGELAIFLAMCVLFLICIIDALRSFGLLN